jgi:hypothetical protein
LIGGVGATLQEHAADDNDMDRKDHQDFDVETIFGTGRRGALRDERTWSIHIGTMLSVIILRFVCSFFLRRGFPSKNHGAKFQC